MAYGPPQRDNDHNMSSHDSRYRRNDGVNRGPETYNRNRSKDFRDSRPSRSYQSQAAGDTKFRDDDRKRQDQWDDGSGQNREATQFQGDVSGNWPEGRYGRSAEAENRYFTEPDGAGEDVFAAKGQRAPQVDRERDSEDRKHPPEVQQQRNKPNPSFDDSLEAAET